MAHPPPAPGSVTVGLVQSACSADIDHNTERALDGIRSAAAKGAQIICLQELFRSHPFYAGRDMIPWLRDLLGSPEFENIFTLN